MVKQKLNSPLSQPCTFESQESLIPSFSVCCRLVLKPSRPSETPIFGWKSDTLPQLFHSGIPQLWLSRKTVSIPGENSAWALHLGGAKHIQVIQEWYFFFPKQIPSETQMKLFVQYPIFKIWLETSVSKIPSDFQKWKLILWVFHLNLGSPNQLSMLTCKICRKHPCNIGRVTSFPAGIL